MTTIISVVVPVYNEESNIVPFLTRTVNVLNKINLKYEIIFVVDPSDDLTEKILLNEISKNKNIKLIVLSRRFGQAAATMAGIFNCAGETCVIIDVDLQDPPELIEEMYEKYLEGNEVVLAKRRSRAGEKITKKITAKIFYKIINHFSNVNIPVDTGDFRLISRKIIEHLKQFKEPHNFLKGLVGFIGFKQDFVYYDRDARFLGKSKYNVFFGSLEVGLSGLIGFSSRPLYFMTAVGFFLSIISFLLGIWYFYQKFSGIPITPGLSTTVILITFFAGIQLLSMGLIGEYVGRIYEQVKQRPSYIIEKKINF